MGNVEQIGFDVKEKYFIVWVNTARVDRNV
jgi:hypothetical protein